MNLRCDLLAGLVSQYMLGCATFLLEAVYDLRFRGRSVLSSGEHI